MYIHIKKRGIAKKLKLNLKNISKKSNKSNNFLLKKLKKKNKLKNTNNQWLVYFFFVLKYKFIKGNIHKSLKNLHNNKSKT